MGFNKAIGCAVLFVLGCERFEEPAVRRASRAASALHIGVAYGVTESDAKDDFWRGIDLAVEEANASGGVLGSPIRVSKQVDLNQVDRGVAVAETLSEDLTLSAVIGHTDPEVALAASVIYEYVGVLYLCPGYGGRQLNRPGFELVFRSHPSAELVSARVAAEMHRQEQKRVGVVHSLDAYGRALAAAFESASEDYRLRVIGRVAYEGGSAGFVRNLRAFNELGVDAVLVAATVTDARRMIEDLRSAGISAPLYGSDALDGHDEELGEAARGLLVPTVFDAKAPRAEGQRFAAAFEKKYGRSPDARGAEGYAAVRLLMSAAQRAESASPKKLAAALRSFEMFESVLGKGKMDARGELQLESLLFKELRDGKLTLVDPTKVSPRETEAGAKETATEAEAIVPK